MALADLIKSHGDDAPSGENLEYDPAFISLELAAQPGEERQIGDSIIAAAEPDHVEVISHAMDVLGRSHDLRAAAFLAYALLRTRGFPGLAEVTSYIRRVLEDYWDTCHPQLDADDDDDPTMRLNAVTALSSNYTPASLLVAIRSTPLTDSRVLGRFTLRDIQIAEGKIEPPEGMEDPPTPEQVAGAFQDSDPEKLMVARAAAAQALVDVEAINAVFADRLPSNRPDLDLLERHLQQVLDKFSDAGVGDGGEDGEGDDAGTPDDDADEGGDSEGSPQRGAASAARGGTAKGGSSAVPGGVNSQTDVRNTLDRLIAYYARSEPSSPVPMLLERAKRLVGANFLTVMKDVAPDGLDNVYRVGGIREDEDD